MRLKIIPAIIGLAIGGCAGLQDYQASCEKRFPAFPDFAACYKAEVMADRRAQSDSRVKLLLLKTDQIVERVRAGQTSDLDAKVEFQQTFVNLREGALSEESARKTTSDTTNCVKRGNKMTCTSY